MLAKRTNYIARNTFLMIVLLISMQEHIMFIIEQWENTPAMYTCLLEVYLVEETLSKGSVATDKRNITSKTKINF